MRELTISPAKGKKLLAVTTLGTDKPGLLSELTAILARDDVNIVDIHLNVLHGLHTMFLLAEVPEGKWQKTKQKLKIKAKKLGLEMNLEHAQPHMHIPENLFVVTVMAQDRPGIIHSIVRELAKISVNIERTKMIARGEFCVLKLVIDVDDQPLAKVKSRIKKACEKLGADAVIQQEDIFRRRKRLAVFDFDTTLINAEIINEMAVAAGVIDKVGEITESGMRGDIEFADGLKTRVSLLKGLTTKDLDKVAGSIELNPGAKDLILTLKEMGYTLCLLTGSFTYFTDKIREQLGFDYVFANELDIKDGKLTGKLKGPIVDREYKASMMKWVAKQEGIRKEEIVAIGDGSNDIGMIQNAGLGIAFKGKEKLKSVADGTISGLGGLLYCLGMTDKDIGRIKKWNSN